MKVPVSWLREYVSFDVPVPELAERLSLTGTKVEAIHARGVSEGLDRYLIGRVLSRDKHPDADRLSVCMVDVGEGEPRQIVCGATNFEAGATVAVVLPGGRLPDGTRLERTKLRGVVSDGMMLSERELELSQEHLGIMLLDGGLTPGEPLIDHLPIADTVIEFEITPNRPDCMNVYGIAREVSAVLDVELAPWPGVEPDALGKGSVDDYVSVRVDAPELCPRWAGRVFTGVQVGPSPPWLKARIAAAGMRPISNVVDITNYVMLGIGEPTHAFDLDRVEGRQIIVRRAAQGERVTTLDGQDRVLDPDVLVIGDAVKPSAIGGLMGSEWSEVHEATTTVLLEAANFDGPNAQRSSARLGLRTEGSARWERGLDPHLVPHAHRLAAQMFVELAGAKLVPGSADVKADLPERPVVTLRRQRLEQVIGVAYSDDEIEQVLTRLGYEHADGGWAVPTWRSADTPREIDLVEEVSRVAGLERLPAELPPHAEAVGRLTRRQVLRDQVVEVLLGTGLSEAATIPFTDPAVIERLRLDAGDPRADAIEVRNPMGRDQSRMRTLVFPSLLGCLRRNVGAGRSSAALFELARVYVNGDGLPDQPQHLAAAAAGEGADFAAMRGRLDTLLAALRVETAVVAAAEPFLHPGRAARVDGLGLVGELHPDVAAAFDLDGPVAVLELDLDALIERVPGPAQYRDVISFPPVRQDIAVIVDAERPAAEVLAAVREAGGSLLASASVFDVYEGPQVGEGRKSLAVHLAFQAADRTLTDDEADAAREKITAALAERMGAELRG